VALGVLNMHTFDWIVGGLAIIIGALLLIFPATYWLVAESWKSSDPTQPSDIYLFFTRVGGVAAMVLGAVVFLLMILSQQH